MVVPAIKRLLDASVDMSRTGYQNYSGSGAALPDKSCKDQRNRAREFLGCDRDNSSAAVNALTMRWRCKL